MQKSIFLITALFSAALGMSCNGLTEVCAAVNCPAATSFQVDSFTYTPSDFNLISFGSLTINNGDVEGRVLVRNNFNAPSQGVSIGYALANATNPSYSLIAGGDVNWVNGEIYPTGAGFFVGGTFSGAQTLRAKATGFCQSPGCLNAQFDSVSQYYTSLSNALAGATATVTATQVYQSLVLNCSASASVYVVAVAGSIFSNTTSFETNGCDDNSAFLFNIMGDGSVTFQGRTFASHLAVYNLPMATSVSIDSFVFGDIIAPVATLGMMKTAGTVTGHVIAGNVAELIQVNVPMCPNQTTTGSATSTGSVTSTGDATSTSAASTSAASTSDATSTGAVTGASSTSTTEVPSASSTTTTGVPSATSTGSTTGGSGNPICTFLDDQASCPNVANALNGNVTFTFGNYDVLVFGDLTANSGDIEGRTFVSGSANFPNGMFSVGLRASTANSDYVLIAGNLNFASGSISHGRAFVAGTSSVASYLQKYIDGPCTSSGCLDAIRSQGQSCYNSLSDTFAGRSTATLTLSGSQVTLNCNSNSDSVYYINTDSSAITAGSWGSATNCNSGAIYVFTIGGSDDFSFSGASFPTNNVVYNVRGSRTVTISTSVHGVILAPQANIVMNSGLIVGKLVASSATIVQVNIIPECVNTDGSSSGANSNSGDNQSGASAGVNVTPSILVMLIALFISKMF